MLKAQHPEFEMWNQGIHARSGVACADCHMPYKRVGAMKISDHQVRSPLLNINRACQTCHTWPRRSCRRGRRRSRTASSTCATWRMDALVDLIERPEGARSEKGAPDVSWPRLATSSARAQFMIDFVEAGEFHGLPRAAGGARILGEAINLSRLGQLSLHGGPPPSHHPPNVAIAIPAAGKGLQPVAKAQMAPTN